MSEEPELTPVPRRKPAGEWRPYGILRSSPALHFYLFQAVGFLYLAYRFASRNYTGMGLYPAEAFEFPRTYLVEFLPIPALWFTSFQWIYSFVPRPGPEAIGAMQVAVVVASLSGAAGLFPRVSAWVAFSFATHVTGMAQSCNMDLDGGTLALCSLLILGLSPQGAFYSWRDGFHPTRRSVDHHWPLFLLFLVVGSYYTFAGLNKWIEVGLAWPLTLHLDMLAAVGIEQSLFVSQRLRLPAVSVQHLSYASSVFGGIVSLIGEIGFLSILVLPRYRAFFAVSMVIMHLLVVSMQGINFMGSSAILLLCVDWNALVRRARVVYDEECAFCRRAVRWLLACDWFGLLEAVPAGSHPPGLDHERLTREMGLEDENGEPYYGADAFAEAAVRCPLLWPFALLARVPGLIWPARWVYGKIARHRHALGCDGTSCSL